MDLSEFEATFAAQIGMQEENLKENVTVFFKGLHILAP